MPTIQEAMRDAGLTALDPFDAPASHMAQQHTHNPRVYRGRRWDLANFEISFGRMGPAQPRVTHEADSAKVIRAKQIAHARDTGAASDLLAHFGADVVGAVLRDTRTCSTCFLPYPVALDTCGNC